MIETLRSGAGVPQSVQQMTPLPERLKQGVEQLLGEGVALKRTWQERVDGARAEQFRTRSSQGLPPDTADLAARCAGWCQAAGQLVAGLGTSNVSQPAQRLIQEAIQELIGRIERLRTSP